MGGNYTISMSGATIEDSDRTSLNSSSIAGVGGNAGVPSSPPGGLANGSGNNGSNSFGGEPLVGITESFATAVTGSIDSYCEGVNTALDELQSVATTGAFQGEAISAAIKTFVDGCREVAQSYVNKLKAAENQIINSVEKVYSSQDTELGGNVDGATASVQSQSAQ